MSKWTGNLYRGTSFANHGRKAGTGIIEDDYSEESGGYYCNHAWERIRFPNDNVKPEELNGECIIIKEGKKNDA